jgi:predicted nucleotidyltransferase
MVKDKKIKKLILKVVEKIKNEYQPEKIILFGSYAYGTPTEDSDIDLFIIKETEKERIFRFAEVKKLIYEPERRIAISPLVYTPAELDERLSLRDDFLEEILEKGEVLYAR